MNNSKPNYGLVYMERIKNLNQTMTLDEVASIVEKSDELIEWILSGESPVETYVKGDLIYVSTCSFLSLITIESCGQYLNEGA